MSKKNKFPEIRTELKNRQAESQSIRKRIHASSGMERWGHWQDKRAYGDTTRWLLLIYAFLRGIPYLACESKTHTEVHLVYLSCTLKTYGIVADEAKLQAWLKTTATPVADQVAA